MTKRSMAIVFVALALSLGSVRSPAGRSPHANYNPAWSPDGARLLIDTNRDGNWEVYTIHVDGSDARRLTDDPGSDLHADWAPDGSQVVFTSDRDGDRDVYVMRSDGSDVRQLTDDNGHDDMPAWSPNRPEIVFSLTRDGDEEIFVYDLNTGGLVQLTDNDVDDGMPVWSPDGEKILFGSEGLLYVVPRSGGTPLPLPVDVEGLIWKTSWAREGMGIALTEADLPNRNLDIHVLDFRTRSLRRLTTFAGVDRHPSWSPDGRRVAFTSTRDGRPDIFIAPSSGGDAHRITEGSGPAR